MFFTDNQPKLHYILRDTTFKEPKLVREYIQQGRAIRIQFVAHISTFGLYICTNVLIVER